MPLTFSTKSRPSAIADVHRVEISPAARTDLETIDDYGFERFGRDAADRLQDGFRQAFMMLSEFPHSAPERPDYGIDIRCKVHRGYRILYRFDGATLLIARVMHHSRASQELHG